MSRLYSDINKDNWKDFEDIITDSLWIFDKRDNTNNHRNIYHGNFVPQIPHQLFIRYTKKDDIILDPFMGSGTSIIEALNLNRLPVGIELSKTVYDEVKTYISNIYDNKKFFIVNGNSKNHNVKNILLSKNINRVQFIIYHPPYWDIVKFSENVNDLSNSVDIKSFISNFEKVVKNLDSLLDYNRYCSLVIGDIYKNSQVIPLSFYLMNVFIRNGYIPKAINVKNITDNTRGKNGNSRLWRYRAITNDFYVFKHEYVMVFKKVKY